MKLFATFLFSITLLGFVPSGYTCSPSQMANIINLAGKQRMLSQKMSNEMLFIAKGINVDENTKDLKLSSVLFGRTLSGLTNGDEDLDLPKTEQAHIKKELKAVNDIWSGFSKTLETVLKGDTSRAVLKKIASQNLQLLERSDNVVKMFEKEAAMAGQIKMTPGMAVTLNIAGRQRMLTQKITKELLLVALRIDSESNISNMTKSITKFENSLNGLFDGDKAIDLPGTENKSIIAQLEKVNQIWEPYKYIFQKMIVLYNKNKEEKIPLYELREAAKLNLSLLEETNKAVLMYRDSIN